MTSPLPETKSASRFLPWLIWFLSATFVFFNYLQQVIPNVIGADLMQAYHIGEGELGSIGASFFLAYAIFQIPVGLICDRYGTRRPFVLAMVAASLSTLGFALARDAGSARIAWSLTGAGSAFSFIGCLKLVEKWFPASRFALLTGMTNTVAKLGSAFGVPLALLVNASGWRGALGWIGGAELALAALVFLVIRDRDGLPARAGGNRTVSAFGGIFRLVRNRQAWLHAVYVTGISLIFVAFGGLWGGDYLQKAYHLTVEDAAKIGSRLFIGGIAGSLFFGWWSDYLRRRRLPMIAGGLCALLVMATLVYLPGIPPLVFRVGLFAVGFFGSATIVAYAAARDFVPGHCGLSLGFLSTCAFAGGAVSQPLVGWLLQGASIRSLAVLTTADYRYAFAPLVLCMGVGVVASLLVKETAGKR